MKVSDILDRLLNYPPDSEIRIDGIDDPAMFFEDGCYVLKDFDADAK